MREFLRHPSDIPVDVKVVKYPGLRLAHMRDVSAGGVSCSVTAPISTGSEVEFSVPSLCQGCSGRGVVVWCRELADNFQVGIRFLNRQGAFQARLVEQLSQIEHYRREVGQHEGRQLDGEQAAAEWIERHAEDFDNSFPLS